MLTVPRSCSIPRFRSSKINSLSQTTCSRLKKHYFSRSMYTAKLDLSLHFSEPRENAILFVYLHGLLGKRSTFRPLAQRMFESSQSHTCLIDFRNHGTSEKLATMSIPELTADLRGVFDRVILPQVSNSYTVLVGHSLGGLVAMDFAKLYPTLVDQLVVLDIAPGDYTDRIPFFKMIIHHLHQVNSRNLTSERDCRDTLRQYYKDFYLQNMLLKSFKPNEQGIHQCLHNLPVIERSLPKLLSYELNSPIRQPTLFIAGTKSNFFEEHKHKPVIMKHFPKHEISWVDTGHFPQREATGRVHELMTQFVEKHIDK